VEHALDPAYARQTGRRCGYLLVSQPDYGEQALEITAALVTSGSIDVLCGRFGGGFGAEAELDGEMGDSHNGLAGAADVRRRSANSPGLCPRSNTCLIFINQIRDKIGGDVRQSETTTRRAA